MIATFRFILPKEQYEFNIACHAADYVYCWKELKEEIRQKLKYGPTTEEQRIILEHLQTMMYELSRDNGIL